MKYFLGIEIARSKKGILLSQRKYVLDLLADTGLSGCKPLNIPMSTTLKQRAFKEGKDKHTDLLQNPGSYRRLVGRLIYLTLTRPNICFAVQVLTQYMQTPMKVHMAAAKGVVRYLKQNPGMGIFISADGDKSLSCYCDLDWASCATTRKSVTGYLLKFGSSLIMWKTKKHNTISRSSAEAEYRALGMTVSEIVWVVGLMKELNINIVDPVKVYCDSKSAIHIANNPVFHERTKYIEVDCHFIREKLQGKLIDLEHVRSGEQEADILTKAVGQDLQRRFLSKLGAVDVFGTQLKGE